MRRQSPKAADNGNWAVTVLELKQFEAPLSAFVVDADPGVRVRVAVNALLLQRRGQTIIVDTGTGVMAHLIDGLQMDLDAALRAHRVKPSDIDLVILTHLHGDHVGGALHGSWPDDLRPAFPNARVVAPAVEVEWSRGGGSGRSNEGGPVAVAALAPVLVAVADDVEVAPGVRLRPAPGHTPGHSVVEVDGREPLVFAADLIHAIELVERPQAVVPDIDQALGLETRRRLLNEFADRGVDVLATHIPGPAPARVERSGSGFKWVPRRRD